ncbi:MAG: lysylphosphatidylglycerol synthase transmembrane domain-containing protein [Candidatus Omnitrophica bacterium]|nr:lysylphosphatidylglycerol synthase transmembrane domain-containing protein [Candidatus Omnitrophota bacterium]
MRLLKKNVSFLLRIVISIVLLVFLFRKVDFGSVIRLIAGSNLVLVTLAFFLSLVAYVFCFFRWKMLLETLGVSVSAGRLVTIFTGGIFFGALFPSTIGSDLVRSLDLSAQTQKPGPVVAAVLLDRLSGFTGMVIMALASLAAASRLAFHPVIFAGIAALTCVLTGALLVVFNTRIFSVVNRLLNRPGSGRIRSTLEAIHSSMHHFRRHKVVIVQNLLLSLVVQILGPICGTVIAYALGFRINMLYFFLIVPLITAVTLLPISIAGLGIRDFTTVFFLAPFGIGREVAVAIAQLSFFFIVLTTLLGGTIYYVLTLHHRRVQPHPSS